MKKVVLNSLIIACIMMNPLFADAASAPLIPVFKKYEQQEWTFFIRRAEILPFPQPVAFSESEETPIKQQKQKLLAVDLVALKNQEIVDVAGRVLLRLSDSEGHELALLTEVSGKELPAQQSEVSKDQEMSALTDISGRFIFQMSAAVSPKDIVVEVDASELGIENRFGLKIVPEQLRRIVSLWNKKMPEDADWEIKTPRKGQEVFPGDRIPIAIIINDRILRPDKVVIIAPNYVFEDPLSKLSYAVTIDPDATAGPYELLFILSWKQGKDLLTLSRVVQMAIPRL